MSSADDALASGFPDAEFRARLSRAQSAMDAAGLDGLLLTTEPEVRYFTGYLTRFWESPSRPWFLIVPASGDPVAVIPSIGAALMARTWISDIRTWRSPKPEDEGVSLLADTLRDLMPDAARIGVPSGPETHLRMPLGDYARLGKAVAPRVLTSDAGIIKTLRRVKSPAEIAKIRATCEIADRAFARIGEIAAPGVPLADIFRRFQMLLLMEGADWVPYLSGAAAPLGYGDVISPADRTPLARGDVLMLDTGAVRDGYFCDFDRNFSIGPAATPVRDAHARLIDATSAAFEIARPGARACDLFAAMDRVVTGGAGGSDTGRLGHGLGMQLTEWPSLSAQDTTVLEPGMVLTLEPGIDVAPGRMMVHEENIVVTDSGARYLSTPSARDIIELEG